MARPSSDAVPVGLDELWDIRCLTCGKALSRYQTQYEELVAAGVTKADALTRLGITKPCCRMRTLSPSLISAPYAAHPGFIDGTYPIDMARRHLGGGFQPAATLRNMTVRKTAPSPMAAQLDTGALRRTTVVAKTLADSMTGTTTSGAMAEAAKVVRKDPISGLYMYGDREITGWVDVGEGYSVPILKLKIPAV